ncbi:MAG: radical SAM protein [Thermodesulfobacteriaceae bacterium]|nr:radical SAM protein [Thermodesulfobacteriaceae bacterium]MDW8136577.1 radical SAM protein [Thermodesulfobacterium sp.]
MESQSEKVLLFGPVFSRRLGRSLGLELVPKKVCTMDCLYCEVGKTNYLTTERQPYYPWDLIEEAIFKAKESQEIFDVLTFTGSGEPTLNLYFSKAIYLAKKHLSKPIAVLTNSSLINISEVKEALAGVDLVLASLDAGKVETFKKVNQPHPSLKLSEIVKGLKDLRKIMKGELWLEVLLVKNINDKVEELRALKELIEEISPHKIQLNTVVRPPSYEEAKALTLEELHEVALFLGEKAEVIFPKRSIKERETKGELEKKLINYLARRPATLKELSMALGKGESFLEKIIKNLLKERKIFEKEYKNQIFYYS